MTTLLNLAHNLIAHPVAGVLWALGFVRAGDWVHDAIAAPARGSCNVCGSTGWMPWADSTSGRIRCVCCKGTGDAAQG